MSELSKDEERLLRFLDAEYDRWLDHAPKFERIIAELQIGSGQLHSSARFLCGQGLARYVTDSLAITPEGRKCVRELRASPGRECWRAVWAVVKYFLLPALAILLAAWLVSVFLK